MRCAILAVGILLTTCTSQERIPIGLRDKWDSCDLTLDCRPGLECEHDRCVPINTPRSRLGAPCLTDVDCGFGACCGNQGFCRESAPFPVGQCGLSEGAECSLSAQCDNELVCNAWGVCTADQTGTAGRGEPCRAQFDCRRPLYCDDQNVCARLPLTEAVRCTRSEEELGIFRPYFEVPRGGAPLDEFFRLPFPNDYYIENGRMNLRNHPVPTNLLGEIGTQIFIEILQRGIDGFGLSPPIVIRFSDEIDPRSLSVNTATATVKLLDIDPDSPEYGRSIPIRTEYRPQKTRYICMNALTVAPLDGLALRPRTTYALLVYEGVRGIHGYSTIKDVDFVRMLAPAVDDPELVRAYHVFQPLRHFLHDTAAPRSIIMGGTVFTTRDPGAVGRKVHRAVQHAPEPRVESLVHCTSATVASPCAVGDDTSRGCSPPNPLYHHFQGTISNPVLQLGERPYRSMGWHGLTGAIQFDADGNILLQGSESLCIALALPRGPIPPDGWPVVLYSHDTGNNYSTGIDQLANDLAPLGIAVLSYDGVLHGPRAGSPAASHGEAVFDLRNPVAARDNVLQGAADLFNLTRLVRTWATVENGLPLRFDWRRIMFYGHTQGAIVGAPFVAYEQHLRAAVLTSAGADIGLALVNKRNPIDVASLIRILLGDTGVSRLHPVIGLFSMFFASSDTLTYAQHFVWEQPGVRTLDLLQIYGLGDSFTSEANQTALVRAMGASLVPPVLVTIPDVPILPVPAAGNARGRTLGVLQFSPPLLDGVYLYNGHDVAIQEPLARAAIQRFFATAARSSDPAVVGR